MVKGNVIPIFANPYEEINEFEGWAELLELPELHETFLAESGDMYQILRAYVRFLLYHELNGKLPGKYNDRFLSKSFITHRRIRVLIAVNPDDSHISKLSHAPSSNKQDKEND
jgi:hypothetical protein